MKTLLLGEKTLSFSDVFISHEKHIYHTGKPFRSQVAHTYEWENEQNNSKNKMHVSTFMRVETKKSAYGLHVVAKQEIYELIGKNMIGVENDTLNFQIIQGNRRGKALLVISHGLIIGDRWLCYINLKTIPTYPEEE
jgi:hypothetical protein